VCRMSPSSGLFMRSLSQFNMGPRSHHLQDIPVGCVCMCGSWVGAYILGREAACPWEWNSCLGSWLSDQVGTTQD
jgi:hypothetical protein